MVHDTTEFTYQRDRPELIGASLADLQAAGDAGSWLTTLDSARGPVTTVLPPGELDGHGFTWPSALSRYGSDPATWPQPLRH